MLLTMPTTIPRQRVAITTATAGSNGHSFDHSARRGAAAAGAAESLMPAGNDTAPVTLPRTVRSANRHHPKRVHVHEMGRVDW